jgi:ketosteroid isomerase-like protein
MTSDEQAVRRTITGWLQSMKALDFTAGQQFWDRDFDGLVYQPEEHVVPVTGWEDLLRYWDGVSGHVESVPEWDEIATDVAVLGDAAFGFTRLSTRIKLRDAEPTFDGEVRCSFVLRRTPAGWRLVHYHESRLVGVDEALESLAG